VFGFRWSDSARTVMLRRTTVGYGHDEFFWRNFVSELRLAGYDDVVSIEHEDDLIDADEGLEKAADLLRGVLIERPVGQHWWETMGVAASASEAGPEGERSPDTQ
jgi:hypothetical protein